MHVDIYKVQPRHLTFISIIVHILVHHFLQVVGFVDWFLFSGTGQQIPVGCNCHVQGYAFLYPPLDGSKTTTGILPPATRTDGSNRLQGDNRKSSAGAFDENAERPPFQPDSIGSFKSFLDRQFDGQFTANGNRRSDNYQTPVRQRKTTLKKKTNYDYHPIIDFFNDRP